VAINVLLAQHVSNSLLAHRLVGSAAIEHTFQSILHNFKHLVAYAVDGSAVAMGPYVRKSCISKVCVPYSERHQIDINLNDA
jgi:hypothetical protein